MKQNVQPFSELETRFGEMLDETMKDVSKIAFEIENKRLKRIFISHFQHFVRLNDPYVQLNIHKSENGHVDCLTWINNTIYIRSSNLQDTFETKNEGIPLQALANKS